MMLDQVCNSLAMELNFQRILRHLYLKITPCFNVMVPYKYTDQLLVGNFIQVNILQ